MYESCTVVRKGTGLNHTRPYVVDIRITDFAFGVYRGRNRCVPTPKRFPSADRLVQRNLRERPVHPYRPGQSSSGALGPPSLYHRARVR